MYTTIKISIKLEKDDVRFIKDLQRQQSAMIRSSYATIKKQPNIKETELNMILKDRFGTDHLDSWFRTSAIRSALGSIKADQELGVKTKVFGSRRQFIRRCKGLITNEHWKESRLFPVYLIGEANCRGNRKFAFEDDKIVFQFRSRKPSVEIGLPRLSKNWARKYAYLVEKANLNQIPVTVKLTPTYIALTFNYPENEGYEPIKGRYAGIDLNPNYVGVSVWQDGLLVSTKLYDLKDLTGKKACCHKLDHETKEIAHDLSRWLCHLRVEHVFAEDLGFKSGSAGLGKNFNRLTKNQWKRSTFMGIVEKFFKVKYVNAAYSSTIGNLMHSQLPDPIAASAEVARRGYEIIIAKSRKFYPNLITLKELEDRWKETEFPKFDSWKDLHSWFKTSGLRYRVDIPSRDVFRFFKSSTSRVYVLG